mgnify:CR=1 FL=1
MMNQKKKAFLAIWVVVTAALFYFFGPKGEVKVPEEEELKVTIVKEADKAPELNENDELPARLKGRVDNVLASIEGMWDPTGRKVKEVGEKMETLEKALEANNSELAEKILGEIEVIVSEK